MRLPLDCRIAAASARRGDGCDTRPFRTLAEPGLLPHVERAERVLAELIAVGNRARSSALDWTEAARVAAAVVNRAGVVVAANQRAQEVLGLVPGHTLSRLPVVAEDLEHLLRLVRQIDVTIPGDARLLRLRLAGDGAPMLVRVVAEIGGSPNQIGVLTSVLSWPDALTTQLQSAFGLTPAKGEVLKDLTLGLSVKEIAGRRQRFESTIRSHVKALLEKTGARSQIELVRLTLGLLDPADQRPLIEPLRGPAGIVPERNDYNSITLPDERRLDYLSIGAPRGRPFLLLPTDMGFTRLPPKAERWLAANGMRMIVPVRAGYVASSPLPRGRNAFDVAVADMLALCDSLGMSRFPILALCDDFHLAVVTACAVPQRVSAIVTVGPTMPAHEPRHYQRMPKWTRFIFATARYAPRTLPYLAKAFMQCIRALGPKRFMQTVLAESKADQMVLEDDDTLTAMLRGSEIAIGPRFSAHVAWAAGAIANYAVDWSDKLAACPVPMILFAGHQDPFAPIETTREFAAITPPITLHQYPNHGQLLYPEWPRFLREVQRHLGR